MEKELGVTRKVTEEKETNRRPVFLTGLLGAILVITYIFTLKNYEPAARLVVTGGIMVYPLTFLILGYIQKFYGFKEARKSIYTSSALYVVFLLLVMFALFPHSNTVTMGHNTVIQYLFANNSLALNSNFSIFYPTLGQFFAVLISFVVSHLLFATIYNAVKNYTIDYLAMGLGVFIAYIIDRILFTPILLAKGLSNGSNTFNFLIQSITSEFIAAIVMSILIVIVYAIIIQIKKLIARK